MFFFLLFFYIFLERSDFRRRSPVARAHLCVSAVITEKFPSLPMYRKTGPPRAPEPDPGPCVVVSRCAALDQSASVFTLASSVGSLIIIRLDVSSLFRCCVLHRQCLHDHPLDYFLVTRPCTGFGLRSNALWSTHQRAARLRRATLNDQRHRLYSSFCHTFSN